MRDAPRVAINRASPAGCVLFTVATLLTAGCSRGTTPELLAHAGRAAVKGQHKRACELLHRASHRADLRGDRWYATQRMLIRCAHELGHLDALAARARNRLSRDGQDHRARYVLALVEILATTGRTERALGHLRAARRAAPDIAEYPHREGVILFAAGRLKQATIVLQLALRLRPVWAPPRITLARVWNARGRFEKSRKILSVLPDCNPTPGEVTKASAVIADIARTANPVPPAARPLFKEAMALFKREMTAAAAVVLHKALRKYPDVAAFPLLTALAEIRLSNYGAAITLLKRAAKLNPLDFAPHLHLGEVLVSLGRRGDAVTHLRQATALNPVSRRAHISLGTTLLKLQRTTEALRVLRRAAALSGRSSSALRTLARAMIAAGKMKEATRILRNAVRWESPGKIFARLELAELLIKQYRESNSDSLAEGLYSEARKVLRQAVKIAPESERARRLLRLLAGGPTTRAPEPR